MTLSNMGTSALTSHAKSSCHIEVIQGANPLSRLFFTTPSSQLSAIIQSSSQFASIQSSSSTSKQEDENADGNAAEMPLDDAEIALNVDTAEHMTNYASLYDYHCNIPVFIIQASIVSSMVMLCRCVVRTFECIYVVVCAKLAIMAMAACFCNPLPTAVTSSCLCKLARC